MSRARHEQEMRNGVEVMGWIEHLVAHPDVPVNLDLICHLNRLVLRGTEGDYWAGRLRAEVDWQKPAVYASSSFPRWKRSYSTCAGDSCAAP